MKYLNKYSQAWHDLSCSTLNVIDTRSFFRQFWVPGRGDEVIRDQHFFVRYTISLEEKIFRKSFVIFKKEVNIGFSCPVVQE